jgi:enoyl-CoA hydratase/carnithine racemase
MDTGRFVNVESRGGRIVHLVLNRPERRNALTGPLATQLADALEAANANETLNVIVVRGAGDAFCSGLDLKEFGQDPQPDWVPDFPAEWRRVHTAIFDSPKIVIGALQRAAINGGASLALACDFLIAGETSFLQVGEIQQNMGAPMNLAWLTLRHSEAVAARVALLGDRLAGPTLVGLGLAYACVPDDEVLDAVDALAERLATHDRGGVRQVKSALRRAGAGVPAEEWFARSAPLRASTASDSTASDSTEPYRPVAATDR